RALPEVPNSYARVHLFNSHSRRPDPRVLASDPICGRCHVARCSRLGRRRMVGACGGISVGDAHHEAIDAKVGGWGSGDKIKYNLKLGFLLTDKIVKPRADIHSTHRAAKIGCQVIVE